MQHLLWLDKVDVYSVRNGERQTSQSPCFRIVCKLPREPLSGAATRLQELSTSAAVLGSPWRLVLATLSPNSTHRVLRSQVP